MGRPGFTLGVGPSHAPVIDDVFGLDYSHPGRHTEEYVRVLTALLRDGGVDVDGEEYRVHIPRCGRPRSAGAGAGGRPGPTVAARRRRGRRRDDPVDGHGHGHRDPRRAPHPCVGRGRRPTGAPHRRRPAGGRARRRRRGPPARGRASSPSTAPCRTTGGCSTTEQSTGRPTRPSSATRPPSPAPSRPCSRPVPPTCGPRASAVGDDRKASIARTRALLQDLANRP